MSLFRFLSPAFWRFDFTVSASAGGGTGRSSPELARLQIEVEDAYNLSGRRRASHLSRLLTNPIGGAAVRLCHYCSLGFDSDACLAAHSAMVHQAAIDDEPPPRGATAFYVGLQDDPRGPRKPRKMLN